MRSAHASNEANTAPYAEIVARESGAASPGQQAAGSSRNEVEYLNMKLQKALVENKQLSAELEESRAVAGKAQNDLADATDHIFGLQFGLNELTPTEVSTDFENLTQAIYDWAEDLLQPFAHRPSWSALLSYAIKFPGDFKDLKKHVRGNPDLASGLGYPDVDADILVAIMARILMKNIFREPALGCLPDVQPILSAVDQSMASLVEPKQDLYARRTWSAQAYNALICCPEYKKQRQKRVKQLVSFVAQVFVGFIMGSDNKFKPHEQRIRNDIFIPAMALQEKILISVHMYYFDYDLYLTWVDNRLVTTKSLFSELDNLRVEDFLQNRKPVKAAKIDGERLNKLQVLFTIAPCVFMKRIGKRGVLNAPVCVVKQHLLATLPSTREKEEEFFGEEKGLLHALFHG